VVCGVCVWYVRCVCGVWGVYVCVVCVCVCVCSGCTPCYIGVYQCGLWSVVQVCLCGEWRVVLTWLWEGCVWRRFAVEVYGVGGWGLCVCCDRVSAWAVAV